MFLCFDLSRVAVDNGVNVHFTSSFTLFIVLTAKNNKIYLVSFHFRGFRISIIILGYVFVDIQFVARVKIIIKCNIFMIVLWHLNRKIFYNL